MTALSTPCLSLGELLAWCLLAFIAGYALFPVRMWLGELLWRWRVDRALDEQDRQDRARLRRWSETRATVTPKSFGDRRRA